MVSDLVFSHSSRASITITVGSVPFWHKALRGCKMRASSCICRALLGVLGDDLSASPMASMKLLR